MSINEDPILAQVNNIRSIASWQPLTPLRGGGGSSVVGGRSVAPPTRRLSQPLARGKKPRAHSCFPSILNRSIENIDHLSLTLY